MNTEQLTPKILTQMNLDAHDLVEITSKLAYPSNLTELTEARYKERLIQAIKVINNYDNIFNLVDSSPDKSI